MKPQWTGAMALADSVVAAVALMGLTFTSSMPGFGDELTEDNFAAVSY